MGNKGLLVLDNHFTPSILDFTNRVLQKVLYDLDNEPFLVAGIVLVIIDKEVLALERSLMVLNVLA
jgi:hypothetical protein